MSTDEESKNNSSPSVYPDPPSVIITSSTAPPTTVTCAVAPSQTAEAGEALLLNSFNYYGLFSLLRFLFLPELFKIIGIYWIIYINFS